MDNTGPDLATLRRRALFRATHRGTKEMDWLLGKYAAAHAVAMTSATLEAFERLLALPDPDLHQWILDPAPVAGSETGDLIDEIRAFHKLGA